MTDDIKCPICGSETILRTVAKGSDTGKSFHVCNRYPECKGRIICKDKRQGAKQKDCGKIMKRLCGGAYMTKKQSAEFVRDLERQDNEKLPCCDTCHVYRQGLIPAIRYSSSRVDQDGYLEEYAVELYYLCPDCNKREIEFLKTVWSEKAIQSLLEFQEVLKNTK